MFDLTQYIVVRRDLPLDDIMPQACHAAGKASFWYGFMVGKDHIRDPLNRPVTEDWGHPTRVIKGARNEKKLRALHDKLTSLNIAHLTIVEPEGPLAGQMTSLALLPGEKEKLEPLLNDFQLIRWQKVPAFIRAVDDAIANNEPRPGEIGIREDK